MLLAKSIVHKFNTCTNQNPTPDVYFNILVKKFISVGYLLKSGVVEKKIHLGQKVAYNHKKKPPFFGGS